MSTPAEPEKEPARGSLAGFIAMLLVVTGGFVAAIVNAPGILIAAVLGTAPLLVRAAHAGRRGRGSVAKGVTDGAAQLGVVIVILISYGITFLVTCFGVGMAAFDEMLRDGSGSGWFFAAVSVGMFAATLVAIKMAHWLWPRK